MPTTKMPVWIRSEYVTIGQPPFLKIRGQKLPPVRGANRLPYAGNAERSLFPVPRIPYAATKGNQKISVSKSADVFGFDMKKPPLFGRLLTIPYQAVILSIERALPVDGYPQLLVTRSNRQTVGTGAVTSFYWPA